MHPAWRTLPVLLLAAAPAPAQDKGAMEVFEPVDPYTQGDRARMERLGYVRYGSFPWQGTERTEHVRETMGGVEVLWVETEHFRIGSSLVTYGISADRDERKRLDAELARLKQKLGKFKPPKREIDPWLRLHLYAQRAEDIYAAFHEDFGLELGDYSKTGPYLGQPEKFLLLLCERRSEFGRYLSTYLGVEDDFAYRFGWFEECMFLGANIEAIRETFTSSEGEPYDSILHCKVAAGLAANFVDGYRATVNPAPAWLSYGLGHVYQRRIDPRWSTSAGIRVGQRRRDDDWKWEPRVLNLVKNDFFASTETMFGWTEYADLNVRDHLVAWSKLDYLMNAAEGDLEGFLAAVRQAPAPGETEEGTNPFVEHQALALYVNYELKPDELDQAWAKWVKKKYKKR